MLRAITVFVTLPMIVATGFGQETFSVLRKKPSALRRASYLSPSDDVLGSPFEAGAAPVVGAPLTETKPIAILAPLAPVVASDPGKASCCDSGVELGCDAGGACCDTGSTCCDKGCADLSCCGRQLGCNLGEAWSLSEAIHGNCPPRVNIGGWMQFGYHSENNGLFNSRPDQFALQQGWLYAERAAEACTSPLGYRVDIMYGIDAGETQAFGNPAGSWDFLNGFDHGAYGWAIPQAYVEYATGDWKIKAGHFYTLVGYEVVTAPDNFFYSHAMTMFFSEPFTHTGVVASREMGDTTIYAGWTLGWDTGFDQLNSGSSWLGGFSRTLSEDATLTYISTVGNFGWRGDDAYSHSFVLDTQMTYNLNYVLQSDLLQVDSTGENTVGINQYFLYTVNDCLGLGARMEWWKGDVLTGYTPHGGQLPGAGNFSNYAATFGANIRPHANLVLRPEVRVDWSPAANYDETYFAVDAILTF